MGATLHDEERLRDDFEAMGCASRYDHSWYRPGRGAYGWPAGILKRTMSRNTRILLWVVGVAMAIGVIIWLLGSVTTYS